MPGATGSWEPGQTWYEGLFDKVSDTAENLFSFGVSNLTKAMDYFPPPFMGPIVGTIQGARNGNKITKTLFGNAAPGIRFPGTVLDEFLKVPDVYADNEPTMLAETVVTAKRIGNMFTDTEPAKSGFELPFWAKTAIVASVIIGTVLIVKGSMERA